MNNGGDKKAFLEKMAAAAAAVRTGGKGSVRRKFKVVHKVAAADDKKLESTMKKLQINTIPNIEEVNIFKDDGTVVHFGAPRVRANVQSNTFVISGAAETKPLHDMLPQVLTQMGNRNIQMIQQLLAANMGGTAGAAAAAGASGQDDDIPDLVDNVDVQAAGKGLKTPSGAAKRFRRTGDGGIKHYGAGKQHLMIGKRRRRLTNLRDGKQVHAVDRQRIGYLIDGRW